jgi:hypothetical protein
MLDRTRPPPAVDRKREQRRARDRRQYRRELAGLSVAPVEYDCAMVKYLIRWQWLDRDKASDPRCIGDAISRAMQEAATAAE